MTDTIRIAMWSGPRNLSTALMRSFGARPDCAVVDEPFYAAYLHQSGRQHPMADVVISAGQTDSLKVATSLTGPAPGGARIFYQKHMVQHMLPGIPRDWLSLCRHALLIRHPARVLASFSDRMEDARAEDIGIGETEDILAEITARTGQQPPIIEAEDIRAAPAQLLEKLCAALDIPFDDSMLSWQPGIHRTDGPWASHWYKGVARTTGFSPANPALPDLPPRLADMAEALTPAFERLQSQKLVA